MKFNRKKYSDKLLLSLYKGLLKPRLIEEKMLVLLRQGKITKWFSGIGQEAIAVGATMALKDDEYILPMHRNLGVFTSRDIPLNRLFAQFQGKLSGFTKGRDRSFHFGSNEHHIVGMISHLGPQLAVADGISLAEKLDESKKVSLVFTGDGGASEGDFHEALNVAAVWNLPVIFLVENNAYGLSTPTSEQYKMNSFTDKGPAYGIQTDQVDGNNILEVYTTIKKHATSIRRSPKPVLIEANTFRMRGHEEASGTKYVPTELFEKWAKKDPLENFENYLLKQKVLTEDDIVELTEEIQKEINEALKLADDEELPEADTDRELGDMYFPFDQKAIEPKTKSTTERRFVDALSDGLKQSLERHDELVIMGQDIAEYGGVFKVTEGFVDQFGKERIRNTPLCESAIIGIGLGMSIKEKKSVIEMQFADFVTCGFNQIVNNLAKSHYRWGQKADVVVRMPTGAGVGAGPYHSQSNEAWFTHTPGLKVVYPSNPIDAKGLICASIEDPNPVMYFEHKALYRSKTELVPNDFYTTEIGKASLVKEGDDVSIITYGMGVYWALEAVENLNLSADIVDLRTLLPWDKDTVKNSIEKTGRVIVLNEDSITGSISAEIAAWIAENCFQMLDAPIMRCGSLDTAVPFSKNLEDNYLAKSRFESQLEKLSSF